MMKSIYISFILCALHISTYSQSLESQTFKTIKGRVVDDEGRPLEYVNIGIKNKDFGTMSFRNGLFELNIPYKYQNDTLSFSHLGFETEKRPIANMGINEDIILFSETYSLSEVTITATQPRRQIIGITMKNSMLGATAEHNEWAMFMKPRKLPAKVEKLNIYMNWVEESTDSSYFRINFYAVTDSTPGNNLLMQNIVIKHLIKREWNELDLRSFNIVMAESFFVSIQWLQDLDQKADRKFKYGGVLLRPRNMYLRDTSFGAWRKFPGFVISMNLQVLH